MNQEACDAGYEAYQKGTQIAGNPYDRKMEADAFKSWRNGWFKAGRMKGAASNRRIVFHLAGHFLVFLVVLLLVVPLFAGVISGGTIIIALRALRKGVAIDGRLVIMHAEYFSAYGELLICFPRICGPVPQVSLISALRLGD